MKWTRRLLGGIGDVAKTIAPGLVLIPGVGPIAAGAVGAAGGALGKVNDKRADGTYAGLGLKAGLGYGVGGYLGGMGIDKMSGGVNGIAGAKSLLGGIPTARTTSAVDPRTGMVTTAGGGMSGGLLDWLKQNPELALGGLGAVMNARQGAEDDAFRRDALNLAQTQYAAGAPMRDQAKALLLGGIPARRDLASAFADPSNPFFRAVA